MSENSTASEPGVKNKKYPRVREIFGSLVFDRRAMRERLPKNVFVNLEDAMEGRKPLESCDAEIVAMAMKDWAISKGATHWAHWFHPLTERARRRSTWPSPSP